MRTDAEISPAIVSGIVLGTHRLAIGQFFPCPKKNSLNSLKSLLFRVQVREKILLWDFVDLTLKKC